MTISPNQADGSRYLGFAGLLGILISSILIDLGEFILYPDYLNICVYFNWFILVVTVISLFIIVFNRVKYRRSKYFSVTLVFCVVYLISNALLGWLYLQCYRNYINGRLAYPLEKKCSLQETFDELNKALTTMDKRSFITMQDYRTQKEPLQIQASWSQAERLENVFARLKMQIPVKLELIEAGNPLSIGPVYGTVYKVEIWDKDGGVQSKNPSDEK